MMLNETCDIISRIISIINQKSTLCTNKIVVICFCPNYVNFLHENVNFYIFYQGVTALPCPILSQGAYGSARIFLQCSLKNILNALSKSQKYIKTIINRDLIPCKNCKFLVFVKLFIIRFQITKTQQAIANLYHENFLTLQNFSTV